MEDKYDPQSRGSQLLESLQKRRLTPLEFQRTCAKWLLEPECWKGFHPKDFPSKTEQTLKHEAMLPENRKNLSTQYYEDNPEILIYISRKFHIFKANEQRARDLEEFMGAIDNAKDFESLKARKKEFEGVVAQQGAELKIKKYLYREPEIRETIKEFEGEIS